MSQIGENSNNLYMRSMVDIKPKFSEKDFIVCTGCQSTTFIQTSKIAILKSKLIGKQPSAFPTFHSFQCSKCNVELTDADLQEHLKGENNG